MKRIHQQLAQIRKRRIEPYGAIEAFGAGKHGFTLHKPLALGEVEAFEHRYQIRLPEAYRAFLLQVGNGGAGPAYGLYPLAETAAEGHPHLPSPLHPDMPAEGDWNKALGLAEDSEAICDGFLTLLTQGCTYDVLLMITGPHRGRIVYVDWDMHTAPWFSLFPDFLTWYETWLRETLAGYGMAGFGYGLPVDENTAAKIAVNPDELSVRRTAALSTLIRAPRLSSPVLERLRQGALTESDIMMVTLLLTTLARHGERKLGTLAWQWLRRAEPEQSVRLVEIMWSMGIVDWVEAAYSVLEQNPPEAQFERLLFKLHREQAQVEHAVRLSFTFQKSVRTALYVNQSLSKPLPVPEDFLTHANPSVRRFAVEYQPQDQLGQRVTMVLTLLKREESEYVRQGWIVTLGKIDAPGIRESLVDLLTTEQNPVVQVALILVAGRNGWTEVVPTLIALTWHTDGVLRLEAAKALGTLKDSGARPALEALLDQDECPSRGNMAYGYTIAEAARRALEALAPHQREGDC